MFLRMVAEMEAKKVATSLAGMFGITGGGSGAMFTNAGILGASVAAAAPFAAAGGMVGYEVGGMTTNRGLGALGGAASGAATGAMIGAMGGPVGVAVGAIIGGAAGLVGGFLGAQHGAEAAAAALKAMQTNETQVAASLANWRAQITGTAADQKAAALLGIKMTYLQVQAQIEQLEAGKKMEEQRNKDLAEAAKLFQDAMTHAAGSVTGAISTMVNMVNGYKLQATIFGAAFPGGPTSAPPPSSSSSSSGDLNVTLALNGETLGKGVIKNFASRKARGDHTLQAVLS